MCQHDFISLSRDSAISSSAFCVAFGEGDCFAVVGDDVYSNGKGVYFLVVAIISDNFSQGL
jgi:hypothetical protein